MAPLMVALLILATTGHSSGAWCVCKQGLGDNVLQRALDYACGAGADCNPIKQNGPCFNPNTVRAHCSYAVNSFFQKKGQSQGSCDFAGSAAVSTSDPGSPGCVYPSSGSGTGSTSTSTSTTATPTPTPVLTSPNTGTPTSTSTGTPATTTPYTGTPTGILGGGVGGSNGSGLNPSGTNADYSHAGLGLHSSITLALFTFTLILFSFLFL